jgi:hypothetical protein
VEEAKNQRDLDDVAFWSKTKKLIKNGKKIKQEKTHVKHSMMV